MNPTQVRKNVVQILQKQLVPMIYGEPGIGKSDIIRAIAKEFKLFVIDLRLSQCDPTDLQGFPKHDGLRMDYAPPIFFPLEGDTPPPGYNGWLLFLDEFTSAPLAVQAAAYKLTLDRQIGQQKLHNKCATVCAGNSETDNAIVNRMSTAMQSRLIHIKLEVDVEVWLDWATRNNLDHRVISYIENRPDQLHQFHPDHNDRTFACPRTWEFTSRLIEDLDPDPDTRDLLTGTISEGIARDFCAHLNYYHDLPKKDEIIADPIGVRVPEDPALLLAVGHMLAAYLKDTNAKPLVTYLRRMPLEFGTTAIRASLKRNRQLLKVPEISDWADEVAKDIF